MAISNSDGILQAVIEATPDAIFVKDLEGRYVLVNEAFSRFLGKSQADIVGKNDFELYPEADARPETSLVSKGPYRDRDGRILGVYGISHDITELREAHETLERTQEALF